MLVLTRKVNQRIQIGDNIVVTILKIRGNAVSVGIEAPRDVRIMRSEIADLPVEVAGEKPAAKTSLLRPARAEAGRDESGAGFSSPLIGCAEVIGESTGLYPFLRSRPDGRSITTSSLAAARG